MHESLDEVAELVDSPLDNSFKLLFNLLPSHLNVDAERVVSCALFHVFDVGAYYGDLPVFNLVHTLSSDKLELVVALRSA